MTVGAVCLCNRQEKRQEKYWFNAHLLEKRIHCFACGAHANYSHVQSCVAESKQKEHVDTTISPFFSIMLWVLLLGATLVKDSLSCCSLPFPSASSYSPCKLANEWMQPIRNPMHYWDCFFHLQLSDEIMQSSLANSMGKKSHVACGFTLSMNQCWLWLQLCAQKKRRMEFMPPFMGVWGSS